MAQSDDQTLFAWQLVPKDTKANVCGPSASHPSRFRATGHVLPVLDSDSQNPYSVTNKGLRMQIPVVHPDDTRCGLAVLDCGTYSFSQYRTGTPVEQLAPSPWNLTMRSGCPLSGTFVWGRIGVCSPQNDKHEARAG